MSRNSVHYDAPEDMLVYLIAQTMSREPDRRLAAEFILKCLRINGTPEETEACLNDPDDPELARIAPAVRRLASRIGLRV